MDSEDGTQTVAVAAQATKDVIIGDRHEITYGSRAQSALLMELSTATERRQDVAAMLTAIAAGLNEADRAAMRSPASSSSCTPAWPRCRSWPTP